MTKSIPAVPGTIDAGDILSAVKYSMDASFAKHVDPIIAFAKRLPPCSGNILEWHFGKKNAGFDFASRVNTDFDRPLLTRTHIRNGNCLFLNKGYQRLYNIEQNKFRFDTSNIWIEYDFPFNANPAIFFDIHQSAGISTIKQLADLQQAVGFFNCALPPHLFILLQKINENGLRVVYYGMMFSRKSNAIRLTINGIDPMVLVHTLKLLGWQGNYEVVTRLQQKYFNNAKKIVLAIDFDGSIGKRIGIEIFDAQPVLLAESFYNDKLIDETELNIFNTWAGTINLEPAASAAITHIHKRYISCIYKRFNHFKLVVDEENVFAKGYLYYCF